MSSNLISWLTTSGLDEQRAAVYLALLSQGEANATELARETGLKRTAVYDNLRVLETRGFAQRIQEGKRQVFIPIHPEDLMRKVDSHREQLKELLPDFLALFAERARKPYVQMLKGKLAAREVLEDIIKVKPDEYLYIASPLANYRSIDLPFARKWVARRVKAGICTRALKVRSNLNPKDPIFGAEIKYKRQIRYLPQSIDLRSSLYLYGHNIGVIAGSSDQVAVIIHSPDLAYSMKQIFEFLWGVSARS